MSKGGQTATQSTTQQLDPFIKDIITRNYQAAQNVAATPYQAYTGPRLAQFRPQEMQAFQMAEQTAASGVGMPQLQQAQQALSSAEQGIGGVASQFGQLASMAGQDMGQFTGSMVPELSAITGLPQFQGVNQTTSAADMFGPQQFQRDVSGFMSPYQESVVDATMRRLSRSRAERDAETRSRLASSRAFGNERRGVYEAQLAAEQDLNEANVLANLYNQGYGQAAGLASALPGQRLAQQQQAFGQNLASAQNIASQRGQMFGEQTNLSQMQQSRAAQLFNQQLAQRQQQQQELSSRLGLQGGFLGQQLGALTSRAGLSSQFANLGAQALSQEQARQQMLAQAGQAQRQLAQQNLELAYQDFQAQRNFPREQLQTLLMGSAGIPTIANTSTTSTAPGQGFLGTAGDVVGILGGLQKLGIF